MDKIYKKLFLCYLLLTVVNCKPMSILDCKSRQWELQSKILNDIANAKNKLEEEMAKVKLLLNFNQHTIDNIEKDLQTLIAESRREALLRGNDISTCIKQLKYLARNIDLNELETCMGHEILDRELGKVGFIVSSTAEEIKRCSILYSPRSILCMDQALSNAESQSSRILERVNGQLKLVFYEGLICVNRIAGNLQDKLCGLGKDFDKCVVRKKCKTNAKPK